MFTPEQQAIINTGRYGQAYLVSITGLKGGNAINWSTLPFDLTRNGITYQAENFLTGIDKLVSSSTEVDATSNLSIAGSLAMLSAFDQCNGAQVEISLIIYGELSQVQWQPALTTSVFYGTVTKYSINRAVGKTSIALQCSDKINSLQMTNSRLLTPEDQKRRSPLDQCLRYIKETTTAIFWGKGVE